MRIELPAVERHPNRLEFEAQLLPIDTLSRKRVKLRSSSLASLPEYTSVSRAAVYDALPSLIGMPVSCGEDWRGHHFQRKCGVILWASSVGDWLRVGGIVYVRDFPQFARPLPRLGMSFEADRCREVPDSGGFRRIHSLVFTGAAIVLEPRAAYAGTEFCLVTE